MYRLRWISIAELCTLGLLISCSQQKPAVHSLLDTPVPVKVLTVMQETGFAQKQYLGTIVESQSISLSFGIQGNVAQVFISEGQRIKKGQVLAILNSENYQSMLEAAKAKEKQAQDAYERLSTVYKNGSLPDVKMVEIETGLQQARSTSQIAQKNLNDCTLYAPADGFIGKRAIEPGMNVVPDMEVFKVVKLEKVFAKVSVSESEIAKIKIGQKADVKIGALDDMKVSGAVEEKSVIADPLSRTYVVKIALLNKNGVVYPGMACSVQLLELPQSGKIVIPHYCLIDGLNGEKCVYISDVNKSRALRRVVTVGSFFRDGVVITSGLNDGENVIVEGYQKLSDSSKIVVQ